MLTKRKRTFIALVIVAVLVASLLPASTVLFASVYQEQGVSGAAIIDDPYFSTDAAVVLVIDTSGSMDSNCAGYTEQRVSEYPVPQNPRTGVALMRGSGSYSNYYYFDGRYYGDRDGIWMGRNSNNTGWESNATLSILRSDRRIELAKAAALKFLDGFTVEAGDAKRMVSLVTFDTDARVVKFWMDVNNPSGMKEMQAAIQALSAFGGTFLQGGLMLARNLYGEASTGAYAAAPKDAAGKAIENRFVVLLTDGNPTYRNMEIGTGYNNPNNMSISSMPCADEPGYGGEFADVVVNCRIPAETVAEQIKNGSKGDYYNVKALYTVAFSTSPTVYGGYTAAQWLANKVASAIYRCYTANDSTSLEAAFKTIAEDIRSLLHANVGEVMITGKVLYQASATKAIVSLYDSAGALVVVVPTADDGAYALTAHTGMGYTLTVTKPGYLSYTIKNLTIADGLIITAIDIRQMAGDVNGDGEVDLIDLTCMLSEFNKAPLKYPNADINADGIVDAVDLTCLLAGLDKQSVEIWQ